DGWVPDPLLAGRSLPLREPRQRRPARGRGRAHVRGRDGLRARDVRDPLPRDRAGHLPDPRRRPRRRGARALAAARRQAYRPLGLERAAKVAAYLIPFEGLYQDALRETVSRTTGLTGFLLELGPFGGGYTGGLWVRVWAVGAFALLAGLAAYGFSRRDL